MLTERGLAPALETLVARRARRRRARRRVAPERLPAPVEAAAYFIVAEALTNVVRYARRLARAGDRRRARRTACGSRSATTAVGGADAAAGSGLRGLADRLAVVGGRLHVSSPPGGGTTIRAEVPCGS